jgi:type I restriction enzyme S subunit
MNKIEELAEQLCPEGVPLRYIWELTLWDKRFNAVDNFKQAEVRNYKYFLASDLKALQCENGDVKLLTTNKSDLWTLEKFAKPFVSEAEIIAIPWGGNPQIQYYKGKFLTADNRIAVAKNPDNLNIKYLYYFLVANLDLVAKLYKGAGIKHPSMDLFLDIKVPMPPKEIQNEIVKILDTFAELEFELDAELEARKKQYEYYRDKLLTFKELEST